MNHVWAVFRDGDQIGTVEAVSRKGACHTAYEKFGIEHSKRGTITVEKIAHGGGIVYTPESRHVFGDVVCSFNPSLTTTFPPVDDKTLETCRQRFETGRFDGFPKA